MVGGGLAHIRVCAPARLHVRTCPASLFSGISVSAHPMPGISVFRGAAPPSRRPEWTRSACRGQRPRPRPARCPRGPELHSGGGAGVAACNPPCLTEFWSPPPPGRCAHRVPPSLAAPAALRSLATPTAARGLAARGLAPRRRRGALFAAQCCSKAPRQSGCGFYTMLMGLAGEATKLDGLVVGGGLGGRRSGWRRSSGRWRRCRRGCGRRRSARSASGRRRRRGRAWRIRGQRRGVGGRGGGGGSVRCVCLGGIRLGP